MMWDVYDYVFLGLLTDCRIHVGVAGPTAIQGFSLIRVKTCGST